MVKYCPFRFSLELCEIKLEVGSELAGSDCFLLLFASTEIAKKKKKKKKKLDIVRS